MGEENGRVDELELGGNGGGWGGWRKKKGSKWIVQTHGARMAVREGRESGVGEADRWFPRGRERESGVQSGLGRLAGVGQVGNGRKWTGGKGCRPERNFGDLN